MAQTEQGVWVHPSGRLQAVGMKGGPLFDAFHGIRREQERALNTSKGDLARAYASAVWAYRCVKLRADAVAGVPLRLLDREGAPIEDHPLLTLLRDVNPFTMNLGDLLRATEAAYNIFGVAYWLKVRASGATGSFAQQNSTSARTNRVKWIQWLNPQTVEPVMDSERGVVGYRQTVGGRTREFAAEGVIVFRNFDPLDDLGGLSPLSVALNEVNADLNAARFVAAFFANDARPAGLLTTEQPLVEAEVERVRSWWQRLFQGARNKWKTGIVGGGLKWQTITFPPQDLSLSELRAEDRRGICAVFGVPPGMAGAWESTTYANAREQKASFYEDTIIPQLEYMAEVLNWSLLPHYPDLAAQGARLAFDRDSIAALRESASDKADRLIALYEAGLITRNEARTRLGLPAVETGEDGFARDRQADQSAIFSSPGEGGAAPALPHPEPNGNRANGASGTKSANGSRPADDHLRDELKRWERFAVRRLKDGRDLRRFESDAISPELRLHVEGGLAAASSMEDVFALFGEVLEHVSQSASQHISRSA